MHHSTLLLKVKNKCISFVILQEAKMSDAMLECPRSLYNMSLFQTNNNL